MTDPNLEPTMRIKPGSRSKTVPSKTVKTRRPASAGSAPKQPMQEWHHMPPHKRRTAWIELFRWVNWLYDRYELAIDARLVECWPQHSELVEELWALKCWREEIYGRFDSATGAGGGQAARYWHTELRNFLSSTASLHARSCRTEHKPPVHDINAQKRVEQHWQAADALANVDPRLLTQAQSAHAQTARDVSMTDAEVNEALNTGSAVPLSKLVSDHVKFRGAWWMRGDADWVKITDTDYVADLDDAHHRLSAMDESVDYIAMLSNGKNEED